MTSVTSAASATPMPLDAGIFSPPVGLDGERTVERAEIALATWRHPAVRDIAWLLQSPPLLAAPRFPERLGDPADTRLFGPMAAAAIETMLHSLDADPRAFDAELAARGERRLGRYAERLLGAWLARAPGVTIEALNLPVKSAVEAPATSDRGAVRRTLGECDALFETPTGAREHWEMAVKFYLYVGDGGQRDDGRSSDESDLSDPTAITSLLKGCDAFLGAGLADRLDWKLHRLIEHQLPLSAHPELLAMAPGPWDARMFVKGRMFYPLAQWRDLSAGAPALAPGHVRAWWATIDTWRAWSEQSRCQWTPLARLEWLAPLHFDEDQAQGRISDAATFAQMLREHFDSDAPTAQLPLQAAALSPAIDGQPAYELSRGFIVPNAWPASARRFRAAQGVRS